MLPVDHIKNDFGSLVCLAMEVRPWLLFHGRAEKFTGLLQTSEAQIAEENN